MGEAGVEGRGDEMGVEGGGRGVGDGEGWRWVCGRWLCGMMRCDFRIKDLLTFMDFLDGKL